MSAIWAPLLRDKWQEGLFEVQELIDSISIVDLGIWALLAGGSELDAICKGITKKYNLEPALVSGDLTRILGLRISKDRKEIIEKIASMSDDRGLEILDFLSEVKASTNLASQVQKNATKKGLYEPAAAAFIRARSTFDVLVLAHAENKLSIRFSSSGQVGIKKKAGESFSKDADLAAFSFKNDKCHAYLISHKYARVGGGHQMNQRADAAKFLAYANVALDQFEPLGELRELVAKVTGREISQENFSWEPALALDGEFFANAPEKIRAEESYPQLSNSTFFIGSVDEFVAMSPIENA
jgi:hypothetical protein